MSSSSKAIVSVATMGISADASADLLHCLGCFVDSAQQIDASGQIDLNTATATSTWWWSRAAKNPWDSRPQPAQFAAMLAFDEVSCWQRKLQSRLAVTGGALTSSSLFAASGCARPQFGIHLLIEFDRRCSGGCGLALGPLCCLSLHLGRLHSHDVPNFSTVTRGRRK